MNLKESFIENDYVEFWIEDGIVYEVFKPHVTEITIEMAREIVAMRLRVSAANTRPLFIDTANVKFLSGEVRKYFYTDTSLKYISATAFLVHNYVPWLVGKIFISFIPAKVTCDLFRTKKSAVEWLKHYKDLN